MLRVTHEPTTSEKVKETALNVAALATAKVQDVANEVMDKTSNDIAPVVAAKADTVKTAAAPHVDTVKTVAAAKADAVKSAAADARVAAAERAEAASEAAAARREEAAKLAEKQAKQTRKQTKKSGKKLDKKVTKTFGVSKRQDVAYKAAALRGQASAIAEDKGLTADHVRDLYEDEFLPHIKELLAAAAAAGVQARQQANTAAVSAFGNLPPEAQAQVAKVAPQLAKQRKKKGRGLIFLGLGALGGAGYLFYTEQQKRSTANAQLSETAIADSQANTGDARIVNNPVTNFKHAEDPTVVGDRPALGAASEAGGPGTAATWTDTNHDGKLETGDLEGETRASRRENRDDH